MIYVKIYGFYALISISTYSNVSQINRVNQWYGNATERECFLFNEGSSYLCTTYQYTFGALTLIFIYLPGVKTISALLGPWTTGLISVCWSIFLLVTGKIPNHCASKSFSFRKCR